MKWAIVRVTQTTTRTYLIQPGGTLRATDAQRVAQEAFKTEGQPKAMEYTARACDPRLLDEECSLRADIKPSDGNHDDDD